MSPKLSRRQFLMGILSALGAITIAGVSRGISKAQELRDKRKFFPMASFQDTVTPTSTSTRTSTPTRTSTSTPTSTPTRTNTPVTPDPSTPVVPIPLPAQSIVAHVRNPSVTDWSGSDTPRYYERANQDIVNAMLLAGLRDLTGQQDEANIWDYLFRRVKPNGYQNGQRVLIKANMNCAFYDGNNCNTHNNRIETLPQVVLGLVESLARVGVPYNAMYIYDCTGPQGKAFYAYFRERFAGKAVHFVGYGSCSGVEATTYASNDPSMTVNFAQAYSSNGLSSRKLADVLLNATYLINIPLLKAHGDDRDTGFTAAFKNHLGSVDSVYESNERDSLHAYISIGGPHYRADAENPMVTIYKNPHIAGTTILTVCDGIYGSGWEHRADRNWDIFGGGAASSLFFAVDPVALDCLMADILRSASNSNYYRASGTIEAPYTMLKQAAQLGLGRYESLYPALYNYSTSQYHTIVYHKINQT